METMARGVDPRDRASLVVPWLLPAFLLATGVRVIHLSLSSASDQSNRCGVARVFFNIQQRQEEREFGF